MFRLHTLVADAEQVSRRFGVEPVPSLTNTMWEETVKDPRYRCLIPITHFANPYCDPGARTRTWLSLQDQASMAWAGFCRNMLEGGPVYADMTLEATAAISPTNDRMPVLLEDHEWEEELTGTVRDVIRVQYRTPIEVDRMRVQRTDDLWRSGARPLAFEQLALL